MNLASLRFAALVLMTIGMTAAAAAWTPQDPASQSPIDTVAAADSLRTTFLPGIGTLTGRQDTTDLSAARFIWTDALTLGDLLLYKPGYVVQTLGSAGQPDLLTVGGIDWRGIAILMDGRPLNDLVTGVENINEIPLEFIDHIELLTGAGAFLYGANGSGATMNLVTRQYNTGRPITKVRFSQGPSEHLLTDAFFSQNVVRRLNVMIGVQRQVTDGRFFNSAYDSWIVRSRVRYNPSERFNFSLTDFYRRSVTGMNGGVQIDSMRAQGVDPFNEAEAIVSTRTASQTTTRRDVTFNGIGTFFADTTWTTKLILYYSTADRSYRDSSASGTFDSFSWTLTGASLRQMINLGPVRIDAGGQAESRKATLDMPTRTVKRNAASWYGRISLDGPGFQPAVFVRGESYGEGEAFSYGASVSTNLLEPLRLDAAYSRFARFPTLQESSWGLYRFLTGNIDLLERHRLAELSATLRLGEAFRTSLSVSRRMISNALLFRPFSPTSPLPVVVEVSPEVSVTQIVGGAAVHFWVFDLSGSLTYTETKNQSAIFTTSPRFILTGEAAYRDDLLDGALRTRLGLRSRYFSRHDGVQFYPAAQISVASTKGPLNPFSTLDLYGVFTIGDAFVTITWENVLDKNYLTVYPYPELGRNIRVGVNWIFLD